jgi:hypothetical protein
MNRSGQLVAAAIVSLSLVANSTVALASTTAPQPQADAWVALSAMSGAAPAAALCGTAVIAAQAPAGCVLPQGALPPPPPPPPVAAGLPYVQPGASMWPLLAALLAVLATDIYIASRHHHVIVPNSPA